MRNRLLWLAIAAIALAAGLWAGLARLGWVIPALAPHHPTAHGPLMLGGFLGIWVGLERAAALGRRWVYLTPALAAVSVFWVLLSPDGRTAAWLQTAASLVACGVCITWLRRRDDLASRVMALGAAAWFLGNLQWALTGLVLIAVPWWGAFAVLTILGQRLGLTRALESSRAARGAFILGLALLIGGLLAAYVDHDLGLRSFGLGLVVLAAWGLRWDLAWRAPSPSNRPRQRFTASTFLGAYFWLAVSGAFLLIWGGQLGGLPWDAALHALFLGFVFSMIFAHAPIFAVITPGRELGYSPAFYGHVALLHASLLWRISGDVLGPTDGRAIGSLLNMVAIAVFLLNTLKQAILGSAFESPEA